MKAKVPLCSLRDSIRACLDLILKSLDCCFLRLRILRALWSLIPPRTGSITTLAPTRTAPAARPSPTSNTPPRSWAPVSINIKFEVRQEKWNRFYQALSFKHVHYSHIFSTCKKNIWLAARNLTVRPGKKKVSLETRNYFSPPWIDQSHANCGLWLWIDFFLYVKKEFLMANCKGDDSFWMYF